MRRFSLRNAPPALRKAALLIAVFVLGALFNRYAMLWIYRDIDVWVIHGTKSEGCKGAWGATMVRFGRPMGQADGVYALTCGEFGIASDTAQILCDCR